MLNVPLVRVGVLTCARYVHISGIWGPIIDPTCQRQFMGCTTRMTGMVMTHVWDMDKEGVKDFCDTYKGVDKGGPQGEGISNNTVGKNSSRGNDTGTKGCRGKLLVQRRTRLVGHPSDFDSTLHSKNWPDPIWKPASPSHQPPFCP